MNDGWVKLHRNLLDWEWYGDYKVVMFFIHCLLKANHKEKTWRGNTIKRGQFITSLFSLSNETGLSQREIRTSMNKLIKTGEIDKQTTNHNTVLTVNNYDLYQSSDNPETNKRQTKDKQKTTTKNEKNDNNEKNIKGRQSKIDPDQNKLSKWLKENYSSVSKLIHPTPVQIKYLKINYGEKAVLKTLEAMENWQPLTKKNKKVYLTLKKWLEKEYGSPKKDINGNLLNKQKPAIEDMRGKNM